MSLTQAVRAGDRLALARLLTQVENQTAEGKIALDELFPHTGNAHLVGVTGAPGTGKSSLVNQIARAFRHPADGIPALTVGVVAVDPSSPFTGGALLGDRVRMRDLSGDPGVFIRSMATRGTLGGLANTTAEIVQVLDAAGYEIILIETVGAGQSEVDIARLADTTLVIEAPNMGDDIQAIKAGILEIADLLVINKADLPGVENTERALRSNLELAQSAETGWQTPILKTTAATGEGVEALAAAIREHRAFLGKSGEWQRRERVRLQSGLDNLIQTELSARWRQRTPETLYQQILEDLSKRRLTPHQALKRLLGED
jgi:LAO/AO transport system kinase